MASERGVTVAPRGSCSGLASSRVVLLLDGGGWVRWPGAIRRWPRPSCAGWEAMSVPSSRMLTAPAVICNLDGPPARTVGHGVEIAGDGDHAVAGDAALQREHGVEGTGRERP